MPLVCALILAGGQYELWLLGFVAEVHSRIVKASDIAVAEARYISHVYMFKVMTKWHVLHGECSSMTGIVLQRAQ